MLNQLEKSRNIHKTYFAEIERFYRFAIPGDMRILELGCHTGRLLASLHPSRGLGLDIRKECITAAREIHRDMHNLEFVAGDAHCFDWADTAPFDYIILSDLTPLLDDVQKVFEHLMPVCTARTRIILNLHNNLWQPFLKLASLLGLRTRHKHINWLSTHDIDNLLYLAGYESITYGTRLLLPFHIPLVTSFFNRFLAKLPVIRHLCLICYIIARKAPENTNIPDRPEHTVSIVIPTRNEKGTIRDIFERTPRMGRWTELIFIDGRSTDGTIQEIESGIRHYSSDWHRAVLLHQNGTGKGQAVRQAFEICRGDILMILDSDLTMPPEDLPKYYRAISENRGEFINGSRLVYPMDKLAMRFLNMLANKIFAVLFTWLLDQPVKDTLCGTKVLRRDDYLKIAASRRYFGDFDPFGDFDLLFGASKLNLKIIDLPIRYRERVYGDIKIERWRHGWLLVRMCVIAFKKLKLS
ncbi:glycosyltransferase [bacterium]|nr:glycosyltransferase [candidate division CSSED10-310 bacterium]